MAQIRRPRARAAAPALTPIELQRLEGRVLLSGTPFPDVSLLENSSNPVIRVETSAGDIDIEMFASEVPQTVAAVLNGISFGRYDQAFFHNRAGDGSVVQASTYSFFTSPTTALRTVADPMALTESGRANTARTVAIGNTFLSGGGLLSWLRINLNDNSGSAAPNVSTVWGRVVGDAAWNVVQTIAGLSLGNLSQATNLPPGTVATDLTSTPVNPGFTQGGELHEADLVQVIDVSVVRAQNASDYYRNEIQYPEGFAGATISEFLPVENPNGTAVQYEVLARYEQGREFGQARDRVIASTTIGANSRGGETVSTIQAFNEALVDVGRAYSVVVRSTLPVAANFSHYDFGAATGEAFTGNAATTWGFTRVLKGQANINDFLTWFNPSATPAEIAIIYYSNGTPVAFFSPTTRAYHRDGMNLNDTASIPAGTLSVVMTSSVPIVAALTHYDNTPTDVGTMRVGGSTSLGMAGANRVGALAQLQNDFLLGLTQATVTFFNPQSTVANITVTVKGLAETNTNISVPANSSVTQSLFGDGFASYRSNVPVFASFRQPRRDDTFELPLATSAARHIHFAEGFMDASRTSPYRLEEKIAVYNPSGSRFGLPSVDGGVTVDIIFRYTDGFVMTLTTTILDDSSYVLDVGTTTETLNQSSELNGRYYYSIEVSASAPVVAQMLHSDATLGGVTSTGGFMTGGQIIGASTPLT